MLIQNVFMELRSRLRSCNVFITTNVDFKKNCNLKICIQANSIVLNYYPNEHNDSRRCDSLSSIESLSDCYSEEDPDDVAIIPIGEFCQIIPNSMSGLKIENNSISFRILTETKNGGTFYTELLPANANTSNNPVSCLKINLDTDEDVKIICKNCSNVVSNNVVQFRRILELPTSNLDMSEWFCHNHGGHAETQTVIKPHNQDFLHRLTHFVVNTCILSARTNKFNSKRDIYHCDRCLAWLGLKTKESVKLFNSTIKINQRDVENSIFGHINPLTNDLSLNDFVYTIESMMKEFNLGYQFTVMCKLVLECPTASSQKQYLLVWIMDKELQVLQNADGKFEKIVLRSNLVTKILYKIEDCLNDEVESWLADPAVVTTDVSKTMFFTGVEHLNAMSLKVPKSFRYTNGFTVSYLKL